MNIMISRLSSDEHGTIGKLTVAGTLFQCDTLELPWRNNLKGKSCITADTYKAWVWYSPHFKRNVIRLEDKNDRSDCLIHPANFAGDEDAGEFTQVHGCTAVGVGFADLLNPKGKMQFGIQRSKVTMDKLMATIGEGPHTVTYIWLML